MFFQYRFLKNLKHYLHITFCICLASSDNCFIFFKTNLFNPVGHKGRQKYVLSKQLNGIWRTRCLSEFSRPRQVFHTSASFLNFWHVPSCPIILSLECRYGMLSLYDCTTVQCKEKMTHVLPYPFFFFSIFPDLYRISASGVQKVLVYVCVCVLVCACVYMINFIPRFTYKTANSSS